MARELRMIDHIQVAKPCPANWDEMKGDDAVRHCSLCRLDVHNLSAMTEAEIEKLFTGSGRVCGRLYRRQDGTILTKDCPRGVRAFRAQVVRRFALAASFLLTIVGCSEKGEAMKHAMGVDMVEKAFKKEELAVPGQMIIKWRPNVIPKPDPKLQTLFKKVEDKFNRAQPKR